MAALTDFRVVFELRKNTTKSFMISSFIIILEV